MGRRKLIRGHRRRMAVAAAIMREECRLRLVLVSEVRSQRRSPRLVLARAAICRRAYACGIGTSLIAKVMHRRPNSILYWVSRDERERERVRSLAKHRRKNGSSRSDQGGRTADQGSDGARGSSNPD